VHSSSIILLFINIIIIIIVTHSCASARTKNLTTMSCCRKQRNVRGRAGGRVRPRYRRRTALAVKADAGPRCATATAGRVLLRLYYTGTRILCVCVVCVVCVYVCWCVFVFCTAICTCTNDARPCAQCTMHLRLQLYYYYSGILHSCMLNCSI